MPETAATNSSSSSPVFVVASSPHLDEPTTSRRVMIEVFIGLLFPTAMAVYLFRTPAVILLLACVVTALITEARFNIVRKKPQTINDFSAVVTAMILGLSLPPTLPIWMAVVGTAVAVGIAKMLFGGLGNNIFNPAMVGRAFLMAAFGLQMTTWIAPAPRADQPDAVTAPTPLAQAKMAVMDARNPDKPDAQKASPPAVNEDVKDMFLGNISGSVGETSAFLWLIGGIFLLVMGTITWHIPVAVLASAALCALIAWLANPDAYAHPFVHLTGGGLMMCAFFIATDPVSCPLSKSGRFIFGAGVGILIMLIRLLGGYPEGVMYAVLLMNAMTPLLDRWTRPTPIGGHVRAR